MRQNGQEPCTEDRQPERETKAVEAACEPAFDGPRSQGSAGKPTPELTRARRTSTILGADRAHLENNGSDAVHGAIPARRRVLPRAHKLLDIPRLARSPAGRWTLWHGTMFYAWPLLSAAARLYRRTAVARVPLIAIVGSLGKSTTAACVSGALRLPRATRPELNGWSWVALAVLRMRPHQSAQVVEVGIDGPGQMAPLADMLRPDIVVVTSITAEHNRSLPSLHVTRNEKVQMVKRLNSHGVAVLNGDDDNVRWMAKHSAARVVFFGLGAGNDIRACEVRDRWAARHVIHTPDRRRGASATHSAGWYARCLRYACGHRCRSSAAARPGRRAGGTSDAGAGRRPDVSHHATFGRSTHF